MIAEQTHPAPLDVLSSAALVPTALIDAAPGQLRHVLTDVANLADNLEQIGLLQPVALRRVAGGHYQLLSGHRRLAAYRLLAERRPGDPQWTAILAVVSRTDDEGALLARISSQVHAVGWTAAEEASALQRLLRTGVSQRAAAKVLGRTESWLSRRLNVYRDPVLGESVLSGGLAPGIAEELIVVRAAPARAALAERAVAEDWTKGQARQQVRNLAVHPLVRDVGRRARALSRDLRGIEPAAVTGDVLADLALLAQTIETRFPRRAGTAAA